MSTSTTFKPFDLSAPGAVDALLAHHKSVFGDLRMEGETTPPAPVETITVPVPPQPVIDASNPAVAALIEQARAQEKQKLYGQIESLQGFRTQVEALQQQVGSLTAEQEAKIAEAKAAAAKEAEEAARKQWEENDAKALLADANSRWEARFAEMEQARQAEAAAFEKERAFAELKQFTQATVQSAIESGAIAPELAHMVTGNNSDEVQASLESVKKASEAIAANVQQALQAQQVQRRGVAPTGYAPVGPMDMTEQTRTLTADQIRDMPMSEYMKIRSSLPGMSSGPQTNRGLFG